MPVLSGWDSRILVLMPTAKDAERTGRVLATAGLKYALCRDLAQLTDEMERGAAVALLTEEVLDADQERLLLQTVNAQPPWSDFPLIILAREQQHDSTLREALNVKLVERPVRVRSLLSVIRAALRMRRHQYQVRDHLEERQQAEAERTRLMDTLTLAFDAANLGTWEWDPTTDRVSLSQRAADICREDPHACHTRAGLSELIPADHRDRVGAAAAQCLVEGTDYDIEFPIGASDQPPRCVAVRGRGVRDQAGRLVRMLGVVQNVTTRKLAEDALRESAERHRFLTELADATQPLVDPNEVMSVSARLLADHLEVNRCAYAESADQQCQVHPRGRTNPDRRRASGRKHTDSCPRQRHRNPCGSDGPDLRYVQSGRPSNRTQYGRPRHWTRPRQRPGRGTWIRTASDGVEAVEVAEEFRPEVILMDVGMPRMNGYDAARRIRAFPWGQDVQIIALTGWGQDHDREQSRQAGCDAHLVKPVELRHLDALLRGHNGDLLD